MNIKNISLVLSTALTVPVANAGDFAKPDFGRSVESLAQDHASLLFGTKGVLGDSSLAQALSTDAGCDLITLARGLKCNVVSEKSNLAPNIDMMVLYPNDSAPTHIIACNEQGSGDAGVQRIRLSDGVVEDIIASGLTGCDPAELTPWGTVIVGEENGKNGRMFEILDPLKTTGIKVSGSGELTSTDDNNKVRYLAALGQLSFEGISVMPNGLVYYQDENRPGNGNGGGGYFKFIPNKLWEGGSAITSLDNSPLVNGGRVFALRLGRNNVNTDFGQGNNVGRGVWVEVTDGKFGAPATTAGVDRIDLRGAALTLKATTGYRPEDQDIDKAAIKAGNVRVCGTNTGQDAATSGVNVGANAANGGNNFGTTFCITDGKLIQAAVVNTSVQTVNKIDYSVNTGDGTSIPEYQILVDHYLDFGMPDNIAYQPGRGNWLIQEDGDGSTYTPARNNDIWDCLDDGADKDQLADACLKVASLNDLNAESTGGVFNATGREYFISVQHNVTKHGVILKITGWK
jgi:secreted PhoX family phosphatase